MKKNETPVLEFFDSEQIQNQWQGLEKALPFSLKYWENVVSQFTDADVDFLHDQQSIDDIINLVSEVDKPFSRETFEPGHITGSALVVSPALDQVFLTHHRKLDKWLQFGGHSDDSSHSAMVAYRETEEESGLTEFSMLKLPGASKWLGNENSLIPFDVDIHQIPARKTEPAHLHFDVRFIMIANPEQKFEISDESLDLSWFSLKKAIEMNSEASMQRQYKKLDVIRKAASSLAL